MNPRGDGIRRGNSESAYKDLGDTVRYDAVFESLMADLEEP
jgi:hypothetical protein